jgi:hypothetical protein
MDIDFNERTNLADRHPKKLKELKAQFDKEAEKYNVYPLTPSWFPASKFLQITDSRDLPESDRQ